MFSRNFWHKFGAFPESEDQFPEGEDQMLRAPFKMEGIWQFPTAFGGIDGYHIPKKCPHGGNEARKEYYKGACIKYLGGWGGG